MSNIRVLSLLICLFIFLCSCSKDDCDGCWELIEVDQQTVNVPTEGGRYTIHLKNYSAWWMSGAEVKVGVEKEFFPPKEHLLIESDWFTALVPQENSKVVQIEVFKKETKEPVEIRLHMTVGDAAFTLLLEQ